MNIFAIIYRDARHLLMIRVFLDGIIIINIAIEIHKPSFRKQLNEKFDK